ncbi:MAG TPA: hypothetical protein VF624_03690 [Tepidisphaeraceae bacterium]
MHKIGVVLVRLGQALQGIVLQLPPLLRPAGEAAYAVQIFVPCRDRQRPAFLLEPALRPHRQQGGLDLPGLDVEQPRSLDRVQYANDACLSLRDVVLIAFFARQVGDVLRKLVLDRPKGFVADVGSKAFPPKPAFVFQPLGQRQRQSAIRVGDLLLPRIGFGVEVTRDPLGTLLLFVFFTFEYGCHRFFRISKSLTLCGDGQSFFRAAIKPSTSPRRHRLQRPIATGCGNRPSLVSLHTVLVLTPSRSATCETFNSTEMLPSLPKSLPKSLIKDLRKDCTTKVAIIRTRVRRKSSPWCYLPIDFEAQSDIARHDNE